MNTVLLISHTEHDIEEGESTAMDFQWGIKWSLFLCVDCVHFTTYLCRESFIQKGVIWGQIAAYKLLSCHVSTLIIWGIVYEPVTLYYSIPSKKALRHPDLHMHAMLSISFALNAEHDTEDGDSTATDFHWGSKWWVLLSSDCVHIYF